MLLIIGWLVLHYLHNFILFLPPGIDSPLYKSYFDFFRKILSIFNNKKKKKQDQVVVFLGIELYFLLMEVGVQLISLTRQNYKLPGY